jgi:hypothetical protein
MKQVIFILVVLFPILAASQNENHSALQQQPDSLLLWLEYLNEKGLELSDDTVVMGKEFQKVLTDENYRKIVYPETYYWESTLAFIHYQDLKKAFWYMINLYPENDTNKELVVKSVLTYDRLFKMDEMLVNTFYTYSFQDPQVSEIIDGKPEIVRPDILERKLENLKEIIGYIHYYRSRQKN